MAVFKKAGSKIFGVQLNKAEQKAMNEEITRQILEHDEAFSVDLDSTILYVLHEQFGFGKVRLQRFYDLFLKRHPAEPRNISLIHLMFLGSAG